MDAAQVQAGNNLLQMLNTEGSLSIQEFCQDDESYFKIFIHKNGLRIQRKIQNIATQFLPQSD
jgi:hypothetical protein